MSRTLHQDVQAALQWGWDRFPAKGLCEVRPGVHENLLVCWGMKQDRQRGHRCRFGLADDIWVWRHPEVLGDEVRPYGLGRSLRSVTILTPVPGMVLQTLTCSYRGDQHRVEERRAWELNFAGGDIVLLEVPVPAGLDLPDPGGGRF